MSEEDGDLFDKIDALFEKRGPDALLDKGLEREDFPILTDVVAPDHGGEGERHGQDKRDNRQTPRRQADRGAPDESRSDVPSSTRHALSGDEFERLVSAVDQRLSDLLRRPHSRMAEALRKLIQDELDKR